MRSLLKRLSTLATDMIWNRLCKHSCVLAQPIALAEGFNRILRQTQRISDRRIAHSLHTVLRDQQLFTSCHLASSGDLQSLHRIRHRQLHINTFSDQIAHMVIKRV